MALEVYWTKTAERKLADIVAYLQKRWGDPSARSFVRKTFGTIEIIAEFPEVGSLDCDTGIRAFLIVKQVTLLFRVEGNRLTIVTLFDNRQNPLRRRRTRSPR